MSSSEVRNADDAAEGTAIAVIGMSGRFPGARSVAQLWQNVRAGVESVRFFTDDELASMTEPVTEPGYPEPESFPVRRCLQAILTEEWEHRHGHGQRHYADVAEQFLANARWGRGQLNKPAERGAAPDRRRR